MRAMEGDLTAAASKGLECPSEQIQIQEPTQEQEVVLKLAGAPTQAITRGCGKRLVFAHMCHSDGSSCDWYSVKQLRLDPLLTRAAYEMHCPKEQLTTQQLAPDTAGVNGCGAQGTYVWSCHHSPDFFSSTCTWVLNNSDERSGATRSK
jgi:hypothetical protein